jgi:uncharacterized membrane protein YhaH (DUF805 family)
MNSYFNTFSRAFDFKGRSSRAEYWTFVLINAMINAFLSVLHPLFSLVFLFVTFVPTISAAVRRMHDVNKSGIYIFIPIYNFILALTPGDKGLNKYDNPLSKAQKSNTKLVIPFSKINAYIILGGLVVVLFGYILMSGGGSADPNTFNAEELFSARRITVAPIVVLLGYLAIGVGIMYRPKKNSTSEIEKH